MNLAIDFGNTRAKAGIFNQNDLIEVIDEFDVRDTSDLVRERSVEKVAISSVTQSNISLSTIQEVQVFELDNHSRLPFSNAYKTPETLGKDRIAAVAGAQSMFPETNCLVIDIGTCITFDFLDKTGVYHGGAISPGVDIRFKSLHTFTANLPLVESEDFVPLIGQSTESCIQSGVINGVMAEINEIIRMYQLKYTDLQIILCGGWANYFENKVKEHIFAAPELVLRGLNRILLYNV